MVISGLGLAGMSVAVWGLTRNQIYDRVDTDLYRGLDSWGLSRGMGPDVTTASNLPTEFMLIYFSPAGGYRMINTSDRIPDLPNVERDRMPHTVRALPIDPSGPQESNPPMFRIIAIEAPDGTITAVAKRLNGERRMLEGLAVILASISVIVLAMMGAAGTIYVRRALLPLKELENTAIAIGDGDINRRAPAWPRDTEYGRLSFAMNTMVSQLQETLDESRQKEEQMRRFVGDASHELRTPLTSLRGYAELYRKGMAPDADMVIDKIEEESGRMQLLVEDLLALTRAEGTRLDRKAVDMQKVVDSATASARAAYPERSIEVDNQCVRPPMVNGDPDRLHQVLMNLINNAFKHGGSDVDVTITLRENLDRIVIEVADNGRGMAEEDAARIFDRFYRADASRHRAGGGGSGLGLAITKSLIEQHEGTITVDTAPGEGATFKISLPLLREVNGATATKATKATKAAQPAKDAKTPEKD